MSTAAKKESRPTRAPKVAAATPSPDDARQWVSRQIEEWTAYLATLPIAAGELKTRLHDPRFARVLVALSLFRKGRGGALEAASTDALELVLRCKPDKSGKRRPGDGERLDPFARSEQELKLALLRYGELRDFPLATVNALRAAIIRPPRGRPPSPDEKAFRRSWRAIVEKYGIGGHNGFGAFLFWVAFGRTGGEADDFGRLCRRDTERRTKIRA